ncbi:MAG TPA: chorismate mutase [Patescibacteria group bacterium]|nr:chorismate mutase [Patescibacteria group bacterium]
MSDEQTGVWEAIDLLRRQIDEIDRRLLDLLNGRARRVAEVGKIKKRAGDMPLYQPEREREIFEAVEAANPGPLSNQAVRRLFECILDESRSVERHIMESTPAGSPGPEKPRSERDER